MTHPWVRCPLCGFTFPGEKSCPAGCPLAKNCQTLCCPNCHYRFVTTSPLVSRLARLFGRKEAS
ncbi:MAG: hypothetical protein ACP5NF_10935 [Thermoanaerobaculum sp.]